MTSPSGPRTIPPQTIPPQPIKSGLTRRDALLSSACGFGALAFAGLAHGMTADQPSNESKATLPIKAKRVIFLFMQGGPSHVDSFDYKPLLAEQDGKTHAFDDARVIANTGKKGSAQRIMQSPWSFRQYGESGHWGSELFPHLNQRMDELCFVHSLHTEGVAHGPATLFLHCGSTSFIRPSMGSWIHYGLGSENQNLPGFLSIGASSGNGGPRNYGNAFLPAIHQGTVIADGTGSSPTPVIRNVENRTLSSSLQQQKYELTQLLNRGQRQQRASHGLPDSELDAVLQSFELAWNMQSAAPEILDINGETAQTLTSYGIGEPTTDKFGRKCLLARRLCEAGVRFIQVTYGDNTANPAWDQHSNLPRHADHARAVDQPVAALLTDLKQRGLLEDTIVWWGGEFGRTPYAEKNGTGRDHNPDGFTMWLAGGGFQKGCAYGATDEFGHQAVQNKVHMHDLHATILHQLGLDHEALTYRYAGRNFRLTDVHGRVVHDILA